MHRPDILARIGGHAEPWDIIIIGGGATGVGCAVDAASRGYDVLLLEKHDFGKGTSSRSTKLIHGGVRYLRRGDVSLVREALRERRHLLKNAPHVVRRLEFIVPCYSRWQKIFYRLGLKIYDLLAGKYSLGPSSPLCRDEVISKLGNIAETHLIGGISYYDAQFDDTRLLVDLAQTAAASGAALLNYVEVTAVGADEKIHSVRFTDLETQVVHEVRGRAVINAAGAFSDSVRRLADIDAEPVVTYSQGIHLVFDKKFLAGDSALIIPETKDGRVLFCIPWEDHLLVGTTDTPVDGPVMEPEAFEAEIDFVLETSGGYLTIKPGRDDVLSVFAGIRPLVKPGTAAKTSAISRGHDLFTDGSGFVTITGGKWTTYRKMAEDAVDMAAQAGGLESRPCVTYGLSILPPPGSGGAERLHPGFPYTVDDVVRAVRMEMARSVEDVLARRTRFLFLDARVAAAVAPKVAEILAAELGKDKSWIDEQVCGFTALARAYTCQVDAIR